MSVLRKIMHTLRPASPYEDAPAVSCAANPDDLWPALDAMTAMARRRAQQSGRVVVLIGADACRPGHRSLAPGFVRRWLDEASPLALAAGLDASDVYLRRWAAHMGVTGAKQDAFIAHDRDGAWLTRAMQMDKDIVVDFEAMQFAASCAELGVSVRANAHPPSSGEAMNDFDDRKLRHKLLVDSALGHMDATGASVYVQPCDPVYLYGQTQPDRERVPSLADMFRQRVDTISVLAASPEFNRRAIPPSARDAVAAGLIVDGLRARACTHDAGRDFVRMEQSRKTGISLTYTTLSADERACIQKDLVEYIWHWNRASPMP